LPHCSHVFAIAVGPFVCHERGQDCDVSVTDVHSDLRRRPALRRDLWARCTRLYAGVRHCSHRRRRSRSNARSDPTEQGCTNPAAAGRCLALDVQRRGQRL